MKNLKKLVSVVLTLALLISSLATSVIAVDYADVETTDSNYEAIDILSGLGVLKGDDLGNFNPNADIKRSEVAAVLARTLGMEDAALGTTGYSAFADVAVDHWAVGYINWAAQQGIVNGRDAQTFDPEAPVKFQEVVKMLVEALGYGPLATKRGGYPTGHMVIASSNAITSGVSLAGDANAPRKIVAQLVYNALDVPLMDASIITLSGDDEYAIYNGKNDTERKTVLSEKLGIAKVKAQVVATSKGNLGSSYADIELERGDEEEVQIEISSLVNFDKLVENGDVYYDNKYDAGETPVAFCGGTDADDMLGYNVIAYIGADKEDEDENRIYAITPDTKSFEVLEIKDWFDGYNAGVLSYYEDGDDSDDAEEVDVKTDAKVIINGVYVADLDDSIDGFDDAEALLTAACDVTLMGAKNDDYSYVFVKLYSYAMVESVEAEDEVINTKDGDEIELYDEEIRYSITFDGKEIALADLEENDVLNIVYGDYASPADSKNIEIIVTRDVVEGTVTSKLGSEVDGNLEYVIAGSNYGTYNGEEILNLGDEGTFYLTIDGKILDMVVTSVSKDYAFIIDVAEDTSASFEDAIYIVQMMTADGVVAEYDVASKVKVNVAGTSATSYKRAEQDDIFVNSDPDLFGLVAALEAKADADAAAATIADRFVAYTLNANSEIASITFAKQSADKSASVLDARVVDGAFKPSFSRLDSYTYADTTKLFSAVPSLVDGSYVIGEDDVAIANIASLDEDYAAYEGYAFNVTGDDKLAAAFVLSNLDTASGVKDALAVVTGKVSGTNNAGDQEDGYTILQAGEVKTVYVTDETDEDLGIIDEALAKGDVIFFSLDGNGDLDKYTKVYDATEKALSTYTEGAYGFAYGKVTAANSSSITLKNTDPSEDVFAEYLYNKAEESTYALIDSEKASTKSYVTALSSASSVKKSGTRDTYVAIVKVNDDDEALDVIEVRYDTAGFVAPAYKIDAMAESLDSVFGGSEA